MTVAVASLLVLLVAALIGWANADARAERERIARINAETVANVLRSVAGYGMRTEREEVSRERVN